MFPARAGMSRPRRASLGHSPNVPRASGDEPDSIRGYTFDLLCSPRERG